ncbi:MAG: hypothetical protein Kow0022_02400 [Phycisphaerales bacterium]
MSMTSSRRLNAIHAVTWAGCLGMVATVGLSWFEHDLRAAAHAGGFVFASTLLGLVASCGRPIGSGVITAAAALGCAGLWLGSVHAALDPLVVRAAISLGLSEQLTGAYVALPAVAVVVSVLLGVLLLIGTSCGRIAFQSLLGGLVAGVCLIAPGEPITLLAASGLLWSLIVLLSISSWARDHAMRLSDT